MAAAKVAVHLGALLRAATHHEAATVASRVAAKAATVDRSKVAASNIRSLDGASLAACEVFS
jgi:hypothetical protein